MKQKKFFQNLRIFLFAAVMIGGCVLGFIKSLRPTHSDAENRDLAIFPSFALSEFLDGTYTSDISLWYSDTFPLRDELVALNTRLRGLYGFKKFTASSNGQGEAIETNETFVWDTSEATQPHETEPETTPPPSAEHEIIKGYLVDGIHGYELYYFNRQNSDRYARYVVQTALALDGKAQVYAMVTPMSYAYGVDKKTQVELGVSDCKEAIDWMYRAMAGYGESAGLKTPIITVDGYAALLAHQNEETPLYFRTDHHWTALGAHYASRAFLDLAGKRYPALSDYKIHEFPGFTGSLAGHTKNENPALENNPDTIIAYEPPTVNEVQITTTKGETLLRPIVNPNAMEEFSKSQRYRCFVDGDYPLSVVHNPTVGDGSAILLIKESYGNAFIPMLVDSYEYVYAIDYRFFRSMSVSALVETYGIDTVLFLNNPVATSADYNMNCLEKLVNLP